MENIIKFEDLNLTDGLSEDSNIVESKTIPGVKILKSIPTQHRIDIIQNALQKSEANGIYVPMYVGAYFNLNILYSYTNMEFSLLDRQDELHLLDVVKATGIIEEVFEVAQSELHTLCCDLEECIEKYEKAAMSAGNLITQLTNMFNMLPEQVGNVKEIMDNFNINDYKEVINFAQAANANRPI